MNFTVRRKWGYGVCRNPLNYLARHARRNWALLEGNHLLVLTSFIHITHAS
jgi:hypothetical protein